MEPFAALSATLILFGSAAAATAEPAGPGAAPPLRFAQVIIRRQMRIEVRRRGPAPAAPQRWTEAKGPRCIPAGAIAGAALLGAKSVDMMLRNNLRIRAQLESSCPAIDFYRGFYIQPAADGMICADRDTIRSRMGGQCGIVAFKKLRSAPAR